MATRYRPTGARTPMVDRVAQAVGRREAAAASTRGASPRRRREIRRAPTTGRGGFFSGGGPRIPTPAPRVRDHADPAPSASRLAARARLPSMASKSVYAWSRRAARGMAEERVGSRRRAQPPEAALDWRGSACERARAGESCEKRRGCRRTPSRARRRRALVSAQCSAVVGRPSARFPRATRTRLPRPRAAACRASASPNAPDASDRRRHRAPRARPDECDVQAHAALGVDDASAVGPNSRARGTDRLRAAHARAARTSGSSLSGAEERRDPSSRPVPRQRRGLSPPRRAFGSRRPHRHRQPGASAQLAQRSATPRRAPTTPRLRGCTASRAGEAAAPRWRGQTRRRPRCPRGRGADDLRPRPPQGASSGRARPRRRGWLRSAPFTPRSAPSGAGRATGGHRESVSRACRIRGARKTPSIAQVPSHNHLGVRSA